MVFAQNMLYQEQCTGLASLWMPFFRMHITYYGQRYLYVGCTLNSFLLQSSLLVFPMFSFCYLYILLQGNLLHVCIGSMPLLNTTSP